MILAKMEIEAWFLAELTHYERMHKNLSMLRIVQALGFDPSVDPLEARRQPSVDLRNIYMLEGIDYNKNSEVVRQTINAIDYVAIMCETWQRVGNLKNLVDILERFFTLNIGS
jgi:hypothetical protein